ncbi:MAG TPA: MFS transporter [Acidimicrobiales bacterium]|jgi:MFS family permease
MTAGSTPSTRRGGLVGLLAAAGISGLGTRMSFLALPWFVLVTTGSPVRTGLVAAAELTPYVLVQGLGGPLVDRAGAKRASVWTDAGACVAMAAVPALHQAGALSLSTLMVAVAVVGALRGAGDSARDVLLPGAGALAATSLERSAGLYDGVKRSAALVGAPLAGVLIAVTSPLVVLLVDAATFGISALIVACVVPSVAEPVCAERGDAGQTYLRSLRTGYRFLLRDRLLLGIGLMVLVTNLIDQAGAAVLTPVWAQEVAGSPIALGVLGGIFGAGAVAGSFLVTWLAPRLPRRRTFGIAFMLASAPRYLALALASTISPVLPLYLLGGLGAGGINPLLGAVQYERVPRHLQARVLGALGATAWAGIPIGTLGGGVAVAGLGIRGALAAAAVAYFLATLAPFVFPAWRAMDVSGRGASGARGTRPRRSPGSGRSARPGPRRGGRPGARRSPRTSPAGTPRWRAPGPVPAMPPR